MKNNLEEVLKEKMSIDMSSPIKFLRTMRLSHYEIPGDFVLDMHDQLDELEQELQKTREQLVGVTEQLEIAEKVIDFYSNERHWLGLTDKVPFDVTKWIRIIEDDMDENTIGGKLARQYFKDKQGE